jgi:hypothetical protein
MLGTGTHLPANKTKKTEPFGSVSSSLFSGFTPSPEKAIQAVDILNQPTISVSANQ